MAGLYKNYEGARGPRVKYKQAPDKWQHKSLVCCVAQESSKEGSNEEKNEEVVAKNDVQVVAEEKLE